ncbi:twin-arginine translocase TatA/TatE family subunit [Streptomyces tateyamensis]|uniref:Twin-arginine translocase TatA/TatE family subunit n=1 Tax=Streptomyces tateyamensis TaxID=565073 RepID=A0A2V4NDE4_9ACTN|nr:twin-arginine translocase TatA/TatE family subunit [Streptomyces tateyamensis]PYC77179.1 twin-arginine translocase TatA/TatE family subunit [Streptomyces tateyamensis]
MGKVLAVVLIIAMAAVFYGGKRLPDLARAFGRSMRILKSETTALKKEFAEEYQGPANSALTDSTPLIKAAPGDASTARPGAEQHRDRVQ